MRAWTKFPKHACNNQWTGSLLPFRLTTPSIEREQKEAPRPNRWQTCIQNLRRRYCDSSPTHSAQTDIVVTATLRKAENTRRNTKERAKKRAALIASVVPMIDYNRKSFIYLQPIIDRLEFWESIIIGKILQEKNFIFI